jgi:hypothetical protein
MKNEIKIARVQKVNGGKISLMFRQRVESPSRASNELISLANQSDTRFSSTGRTALLTGEPTDLIKLFPYLETQIAEANNLGVGDYLETDIEAGLVNGKELNIQVVENTIQDPKRPNQEPKRRGKEGPIMTFKGQSIYSHTTVVLGEPKNVWLEADEEGVSISSLVSDLDVMGQHQ